MFEHRSDPLLSRSQFFSRIWRALLFVVLVLAVSLIIGTCGYRVLGDMAWLESFHRACFVLSEHPVEGYPHPAAGIIFDGVYVMIIRLVFFSVLAILGAPILHRILHRLHLDTPMDRP